MALAALSGIWLRVRKAIGRPPARPPEVPATPAAHAELMRGSWDEKAKALNLGAISFLKDPGASWSEDEFSLVGERFVDRMLSRFAECGAAAPFEQSSILEIGCGAGRFLKPLSARFRRVVGVDVSPAMLDSCRSRLSGAGNVELQVCNGLDLSQFTDGAFDYCISAGVFQHITSTDIITAYVREGLRVTRPGGLFLFQFHGCHTHTESGSVMSGARLAAKDLDRALATDRFRIRELSNDPLDRYGTLVVVLERLSAGDGTAESQRLFSRQAITRKPWVSGVYDGITVPATGIPIRPGEEAPRITFFD